MGSILDIWDRYEYLEELFFRLWHQFLSTDFSERNLNQCEEEEWADFSVEQIEEFLDSYGVY